MKKILFTSENQTKTDFYTFLLLNINNFIKLATFTYKNVKNLLEKPYKVLLQKIK